jgi:hypothetical protein
VNGTVYLGDFDAEKYWRDLDLIKLPSLEDQGSAGIILAMDELLFPFCQKEDVLITRFAFNPVLKAYLQTVGFEFKSNESDFQTEPAESQQTICAIITGNALKLAEFLKVIDGCRFFSSYAILPGTELLAQKAALQYPVPAWETVKKVNSKEYSMLLSKKLGCGSHGEIVHTSGELFQKGEQFLKKGDFLIKDCFGVSGKGNLLVRSVRVLKRIVKYLETWENKGKTATFIIEQFLDKELDFSCGLIIKPDGQTVIISIQKISNHQFAYGGSETAAAEFIDFLSDKKYFNTLTALATELYQAGYWGEVCVDSMLLKTGEIVPIIEINARISMGFINKQLDSHLIKFGLKGNLMKLELGSADTLVFADVLTKLQEKKVLFERGGESGIIPVSANTLLINKKLAVNKAKGQIYKGRIYFSVLAQDATEKARLLQGLVVAFEALACKIYSKI